MAKILSSYYYRILYNYINNLLIQSYINTSFKSGDFIGVAGQSGSGKSTFIDLITGLVVPSSGSICVNNIPRDLFPQVKLNLANNLFLVDQQNFICHGTIKENIM